MWSIFRDEDLEVVLMTNEKRLIFNHCPPTKVSAIVRRDQRIHTTASIVFQQIPDLLMNQHWEDEMLISAAVKRLELVLLWFTHTNY